ncbi:adenylate kinase isoenzyme 5-like [Lytechinus pictus]|uniref:adenylate kinase isoenzyme 5-like n=1 Tax=Lytechinus pictus TaxID=7653 RepID=UPI0030B9D963
MGEKEDSEKYLKRRRIRELFQSLMAGLLFHKPEDHIAFLIACLTKLHEDPLAVFNIRWNTFIEHGPEGGRMAGVEMDVSPEQINMQLQTFLSGSGFLY